MRKTLSVIAIVTVFAMMLTASGCGASGPEAMVEGYIEAMFSGDTEAVLDCMPEFALEKAFEGMDRDKVEEQLGAMLKLLTAMVEDYDYSVEIVDDDSDELIEKIEEEYDLSKKDLNSIEEACMVEIELTIEAKDEEETTTQEVVCVKIDGDWYILQADLF